MLKLLGACRPGKQGVNGIVFTQRGKTANGAPYYAGGDDYFIYWDQDCAGNKQEPARWILDINIPSTKRTVDLDGDGECNYVARFDSDDRSGPPVDAKWEHRMISLAPPYKKLPAGSSCSDERRAAILDTTACPAAAQSLGLPFAFSSGSDPKGCFFDANTSKLYLATNEASRSYEVICGAKSPAKDTEALLSAAPGLQGVVLPPLMLLLLTTLHLALQ